MRYALYIGNSRAYYTDKDRRWHWDMAGAKAVARNIARKRNVTVHVRPITADLARKRTPRDYDAMIEYVNSLKGRALHSAMLALGLPKGGDPVASKRQRLIAYYDRTYFQHVA